MPAISRQEASEQYFSDTLTSILGDSAAAGRVMAMTAKCLRDLLPVLSFRADQLDRQSREQGLVECRLTDFEIDILDALKEHGPLQREDLIEKAIGAKKVHGGNARAIAEMVKRGWIVHQRGIGYRLS